MLSSFSGNGLVSCKTHITVIPLLFKVFMPDRTLDAGGKDKNYFCQGIQFGGEFDVCYAENSHFLGLWVDSHGTFWYSIGVLL
jgi:membrane protease subunit (stomatin/prohibitin family)